MGHWWDSKKRLWLLTPEELSKLEKGTEVVNICGGSFLVGTDELDMDTRFGHTAYGIWKSTTETPYIGIFDNDED